LWRGLTMTPEMGRTDLRWLDNQGQEVAKRGRKNYLFRSAVTDEAQERIEQHDFEGSYVRDLGTGHAETEWINLAMLCLAELHDGIVGVTLDGLAKNPIAQTIIGLPAGIILYETLEAPSVFNVSTGEGVGLPQFDKDYAGFQIWSGKLPGGGKTLIPSEKDGPTNRQVEKISRNVYIEFQPDFVARLGSVDGESECLNGYRAMVKEAKATPVDTSNGAFQMPRYAYQQLDGILEYASDLASQGLYHVGKYIPEPMRKKIGSHYPLLGSLSLMGAGAAWSMPLFYTGLGGFMLWNTCKITNESLEESLENVDLQEPESLKDSVP